MVSLNPVHTSPSPERRPGAQNQSPSQSRLSGQKASGITPPALSAEQDSVELAVHKLQSTVQQQKASRAQLLFFDWSKRPDFLEITDKALDSLIEPEQKQLLQTQLAKFVKSCKNILPEETLAKLALRGVDEANQLNYPLECVTALVRKGGDDTVDSLLPRLQATQPEQLKLIAKTLVRGTDRPASERLWRWSRQLEKQAAPTPIESHSSKMQDMKATARQLPLYLERLDISEADLRNLQGKQICLAGGGYSPIKQGLREKGIHANVVNIDPICTEANLLNEDVKIPKNFFSQSVKRYFQNNRFNEIWALNSLPQYAMNPEEVINFYTRSLQALKPDGVLRAGPVSMFADAFTPAMALARPIVSETSEQVLDEISKRPDLFEIKRSDVPHYISFDKKRIQTGAMPTASIRIVGKAEPIRQFLLDLKRQLPARLATKLIR